MTEPFVPFGRDHLGALAATALLAAGLAHLVRRDPRGPMALTVRVGLALSLAGVTAATLIRWGHQSPLTIWDVLPLHLCDFLILLAVVALFTLRPLASELVYFWACSGTLLAMVWPDLGAGFPDWRFLSYFALHGLVVVSAVTLTAGFRLGPRPGAPWRVFLVTNAYAAVVAFVDAAFDMNFLYLRSKPGAPTILDHFGPWPWYILSAEVLALALFFALDLPFRRRPPAPPAKENGAPLAPSAGAR